MVESCLSAAIYTQTTDVEVEVNGLMSYDREVLKFDAEKLARAHQALYAPLRELSDAERSRAYTVAYWRFEDTAAGKLVPHDRKKRDSRQRKWSAASDMSLGDIDISGAFDQQRS